MKQFLIFSSIILLYQFSFAQNEVQKRDTLEVYENGEVMREHIKFLGKDTVVEKIYFQNGQLNYYTHLFGDKRNGTSFTYDENGKLIFEENYIQNKLSGAFKAFYPTGKISRTERYDFNRNVDTTFYYSEKGEIATAVVYRNPCEFGSNICNQIVTVYENGLKVYSYEVVMGLKSEKHTVFDNKVYQQVMTRLDAIPLIEKGKTVFKINCGMCHTLDHFLVAPPLRCFTKSKSGLELKELMDGANGHLVTKLSEEEFTALKEYLNKNCTQQQLSK